MSFLWAKTLISRKEAIRIVALLMLADFTFFCYILVLISQMAISSLDFNMWASSSRTYQYTLLIE